MASCGFTYGKISADDNQPITEPTLLDAEEIADPREVALGESEIARV